MSQIEIKEVEKREIKGKRMAPNFVIIDGKIEKVGERVIEIAIQIPQFEYRVNGQRLVPQDVE